MSLRAIPYGAIGPKRWDRFCLAASGAWFWHTSRWLEYQEARGRDNASFAVEDGGEILAACPLIEDDGRRFRFEGHPGPWPAFRDRMGHTRMKEVARFLSGLIAYEAEARRVRSCAFRSCPLVSGPPCLPGIDRLPGWHSRVARLSAGPAELHAGLRKSYTSLINRGLRELEFIAGMGNPEARSAVQVSERLHAEAAGRRTRPTKTWDLMGDWAAAGDALALMACRPGAEAVGFAYFIFHKGDAYYASAAALEPNVAHAILWRGILALHELGIGRLEIGWQGQASDEKGRAVEFFKSGFPGHDMPVVVAERRFA